MMLYGDVKYGIAKGLEMCEDDSRVMYYTNRAESELADAVEDFKGKHVELRVCVQSGNITWPPWIETIERLTIDDCCQWKTKMRDFWFEFLDNAIPYQENCSQPFGGITADRSNSVTFDAIRGPSKKLKIYTDVQEAEGATVRLTGTGTNGTRIRQLLDGQWQDGETLLLNNVAPPETINIFASIDGVYFSSDPRNGYARLYEVDTDNPPDERLLAIYEPWQNRPEFRQSFVSGICNAEDQWKTVRIIGKRGKIKITSDKDVLLIQNENALIEMTKAIKERDNNVPTARAHRDAAIELLKDQFKNWNGMSARKQITFQRPASWGFGRANVTQGMVWGGYWGGR